MSSVASDIMGVSGRAMPEALIAGVDDPAGPPAPAALVDLVERRLRSRIPALVEALTGRFTVHHAFLVRLHLDRLDRLTTALDALAARIETQITPFSPAVELLTTIPGVDRHVAEVIVAETGGDMSAFPSADHVASWAGVAPRTAGVRGSSSFPTTVRCGDASQTPQRPLASKAPTTLSSRKRRGSTTRTCTSASRQRPF